jgi:hypothetical protein
MRFQLASAGLALFALASPAFAQSSDTVKPYIVLTLDVSGSMNDPVAGPPEPCSGGVSKFDHARCAIQNLANTHGDVVFALARFRQTCSSCNGSGIDCAGCDEATGTGCTATMNSPDRFELLVPLVDEGVFVPPLLDNADEIVSWCDFSCGACGYDPAVDPELDTGGYTPVGGSLRGARRYWQGLDPFYAADLAGIYGVPPGDPIRNDPLKTVFLPSGEQCRPYIVIQLTDGDETCEQFTGTEAAAAALLTTDVDGLEYRIETRPIGFGQTPCDTQIEGIAHAGGAPDVGGVCEGLYAQNAEELSIAFNTIIAETLRVEVCNGVDDDCDLLIDEGFQLYCDLDGAPPSPAPPTLCVDPGDDCDGVDDNCWLGTSDEAFDPTKTELCNGIDDDCDGLIDEGAGCGSCGEPEVCDNVDNDCDGSIDEGLVRPCGFPIPPCTVGTETCVAGAWVGCDAVLPTPEVCNGIDDDCNGATDGMSEPCTDLPDPPGNPGIGICMPGVHICLGGMYGPCLGEVTPQPEACDGLDNDCDGPIDEGIPPADCSTTCGPGTTACVGGMLECDSTMVSMPEVCNGIDDDCNGLIDDGIPPMGPCGSTCTPGELQCIGGGWVCVGGGPDGAEICDCADNDCDGSIDEGVLCPPGATCTSCQCAYPCDPGEFPCPVGRTCVDDFCIIDTCFGVDCGIDGAGDATTCVDGTCVPICDTMTCAAPLVCRRDTGACVTDDCAGFPERCDEGELCVAGECLSDPCYDVACVTPGEYCFDGDCVASCATVTCADGQICVLGECVADPCAADDCGPAEVCNPGTGMCVPNPCLGVSCPGGEWCNPQTGACEPDPCVGVHCPTPDEVCIAGGCYDPETIDPPDAGPPPSYEHITTGGGGCTCRTGGGAGRAPVLLLAALAWRRRRRP